MRVRGILGAVGLAALVSVVPAAAQQSLTWTAGAVGGGWYAICGGMAELLREKAQLNIKVIPGGGVQNPPLVQKGEADLGMGLPSVVRLPCNDPFEACKVLDAGAGGVIGPYVESADQVRGLVGAVKLRPLKGRRLQEALRDRNTLEPGLRDYLENRNGDKIVIASNSCPLAAAVAVHPEVCRLAETLIAEIVKAPVAERCDRNGRPKCIFEISHKEAPKAQN